MAYRRLKFFWGAIDSTYSDESPYTAQETKPMGLDALEGIGVRRAMMVFRRTIAGSLEDQVVTHFDIQNMTSGEPDDTWTDQDFILCETALDNFIGGVQNHMTTHIHFAEVRWYKIGPGIVPPNPAIRVTASARVGTAAGSMAPQVAITMTEKTVPRRQWGRQYLPLNAATNLDNNGRIGATVVNDIANAGHTLATTLNDADFPLVVYSPTRQKAYAVETLQVDDLADVVRSRRYDHPTLREVRGAT